MAGILPSPEESTTTAINGFDHCLRDGHSRHEVKWDGAEHSTGQSESTSPVEGGTPTGQILVTRRDKGKTVRHSQLVRRKGEAKVGLGKGGDNGAKGSSKLLGDVNRDANGKKSSFMVLDGESSGIPKNLQDMLGLQNSIPRTLEED